MSKETFKEIRKTILFIAVIILGIVYSHEIVKAIVMGVSVIKPFIWGFAIAFILNIPIIVIEDKLMNKWQSPLLLKIKRGISITLAFMFVCLILFFVGFALMPVLAVTIKDIVEKIPDFANRVIDICKEYPVIYNYISDINVESINWSEITNGAIAFLESGAAGNLIASTANMAGSVATFFVNAVIAVVFAIYLLAGKEKVIGNIKTVCNVYLPGKIVKRSERILKVMTEHFKKYTAGQCLEAIILGVIMAVAMAMFKMPYVILNSVIIAITALVPVAGAFVGGLIGAILILIISPVKMIQFLILFNVIQQIENKLIYPKVVGSSVGLPAIWVFVAVTIGGSLFGVMGMLVFIPITSTAYALLKEDVLYRQSRLKSKKYKRKKR